MTHNAHVLLKRLTSVLIIQTGSWGQIIALNILNSLLKANLRFVFRSLTFVFRAAIPLKAGTCNFLNTLATYQIYQKNTTSVQQDGTYGAGDQIFAT